MLKKCFAAMLAVFFGGIAMAGEFDYDKAWTRVHKAVMDELPKTAVKELSAIEKEAVGEGRWAMAVRCAAERMRISRDMEGKTMEELLPVFSDYTEIVPEPMRPAMEMLMAHLYWTYYRENRWIYILRTSVGGSDEGKDPSAWSLPRILKEIEYRFQKVDEFAEELKSVPVETYNDLFLKGNAPDECRPTLFDIFAWDRIDFWSQDLAVIRADSDPLDADGFAFAPTEKFLQAKAPASSNAGGIWRAVSLLQKVLAFHKDDKDRTAFADADLNRLVFCHVHSIGDDKDKLYADALDQYTAKWRDKELSVRAGALRANLALKSGDPGLAKLIAARAMGAFPNSPWANECKSIIAKVEHPELSFSGERIWGDPLPAIKIRYRNLTDVSFKLVKLNQQDTLHANFFDYRYTTWAAEIGKRKAANAWTQPLPPCSDYKERTFEASVPKDVKPGVYLLFASSDPTFGKANTPVEVALVNVTKLALVLRERDGMERSGCVVLGKEGTGVSGAEVQLWQSDGNGKTKLANVVKTDENGYFSVSAKEEKICTLRVLWGGEETGEFASEYFSERSQTVKSLRPETKVFTDRAIYRPGQTIHFKGILFQVDAEKGSGGVLADKKVTVNLNDRNRKTLETLELVTNEYGSYSGKFTAPGGTVTGELRIECVGFGSTAIRVEEYKRPTFFVEIDEPPADSKLDEKVLVTGTAKTYNGLPLQNAKVQWRVSRRSSLPWWIAWRYESTGSTEIAQGVAETGSDGSFAIVFHAKPDKSISASDEPVFYYTTHADVVDTRGETRSAENSVSLAYSAWRAHVDHASWLTADKPVAFTLGVNSLNGKPVHTRGELKIFTLKQPSTVKRSALKSYDSNAVEKWETETEIAAQMVETDENGVAKGSVALKPGAYRFVFEVADHAGKRVTARSTAIVLDTSATAFPVAIPDFFKVEKYSVETNGTFRFLWGTGYDAGVCHARLLQKGKVLFDGTNDGNTQWLLEFPAEKFERGQVAYEFWYEHENRLYTHTGTVEVPRNDLRLSMKLARFKSKLRPGENAEWSLMVNAPDDNPAIAEIVATLYDRSLDAYAPLSWPWSFSSHFYRSERPSYYKLCNDALSFRWLSGRFPSQYFHVRWEYRQWRSDVAQNWAQSSYSRIRRLRKANLVGRGVEAGMMLEESVDAAPMAAAASDETQEDKDVAEPEVRKNLQETAFFFPQLVSDKDGMAKFTFTMPEALTGWKFRAFAHDANLRSASLVNDTIVTAKELMVQPNPPRFVREGDEFLFAAKVTNAADTPQSGKVKLVLEDAVTLNPVDILVDAAEQEFAIAAGRSQIFEWHVRIPEGQGFLVYRFVAESETFSDGEENYLPVLPRKVAVMEAMTLPVNGKGTKLFEFTPLVASAESSTLRHMSLAVQAVTQPAWYAVLALPYLMEYPYECNEQTFSRYYANTLAEHIANSDPRIRAVFDEWKKAGEDSMLSPLEKNQELKALAIEATPWLLAANSETQQRRDIGILFDTQRLAEEKAKCLKKLKDNQQSNGTWPWFPGGEANEYITLCIATGFARLAHLTGTEEKLALDALPRLDDWMREIREKRLSIWKDKVPRACEIMYLYMRSFHLPERKLAKRNQANFDALVEEAIAAKNQYMLRTQAQLALALNRLGKKNVAQALVASFSERAKVSEEMGMYWRTGETPWSCWAAPIETQALMIEVYREVANDAKAVADCQLWLLKQKQTQRWKTTTATADAIYALLLSGRNLLAEEKALDVTLGGDIVPHGKEEAGTGFWEWRYSGSEVQSNMGDVAVTKHGEGPAWASLYWQYLEDVAKVPETEGTPLKVSKKYFIKKRTNRGAELIPLDGAAEQGDELVARIEIRSDRLLEFVHMRDERPACAEPVNVLSGYRWQDGLGYYESTRDVSTDFFFDRLPKGTYVFEYSCRVQQRGIFETGLARIQCMYAPEFAAHSASSTVVVR